MSEDSFHQLQVRITEKIMGCEKQLDQIGVQISSKQRESRLAALTKREIEGLDSSIPLYKSMGKMFVQENKESLLNEIEKTTGDANTLIEALEKKQKFVKRDLDEAVGNLKDTVRAAQNSTAK
ncbi:hypothetical protein GGI25_005247 [Coemansia spiralis]|uniref:Prefoldin subunit 1 n=2 Tax=Coemansia TaxID=4863 RepID=A0A9W8KWA2_9FUNG|nr:hypothetical protein BX070DRAFT_226168 [Coemansia spiralis]KAJ1986691.1 hypothetical protein EDC05_006196 [Coemansia umbellata]KAJ2621401.1 hypothetical protein GGI26_004183 [Coemansia sp. RSA 1358]KAJ2672053.1 hypothetical protein GGI25_005247 [Coemansia spiralis]